MTVKTRRGAGAGLIAAAVGLLAATIGNGTAAQAQEATGGIATYPTHPFSVHAGLFLPRANSTRDDLGIDWLSYGASYDFHTAGSRVPQTYSVYIEYFDQAKTRYSTSSKQRTEASALGIGIADRYYFLPELERYQPYAGAGFGVYNTHAKVNFSGLTNGFANEYKTSVGGKVFAGVEIREGIFGEVSYNFLPEPKLFGSRIKLSGYQIQLGYRF